MGKLFVTVLGSLLLIQQSDAQAFEDKIEYNKEKQLCLAMEYIYSTTAVENALIGKLEKLGHRGKEEKGLFNKDKGFRVYKNIVIHDISAVHYDYIVNVGKKSRKAEEEAVLYFIIQKNGKNFLSELSRSEIDHAKKFLYDLIPDIAAADLELQITAQEETISKAEKTLKSLQDDQSDMEKKLKKLQEDLQKNEEDQEKQQAEIENQKNVLETLKGRRKSTI